MKMKERDHKKNKFVNHISAFGEMGIDPCCDSELPQIWVKLTGELQMNRNAGYNDWDGVVEVTVCRCRWFESPEADVVKSLVISAEGLVGVLGELINWERRRTMYSVSNLRVPNQML
jgi:hypothetical protein